MRLFTFNIAGKHKQWPMYSGAYDDVCLRHHFMVEYVDYLGGGSGAGISQCLYIKYYNIY